MDNEKNKDLELNTPEIERESDSEPITADDLIKRLKSNLKTNFNGENTELTEQTEEAAESISTEVETEGKIGSDTEEFFKAMEESYQKAFETSEDEEINPYFDEDKLPELEEVAEEITESKPERKSSVTETIKNLIASLKFGGNKKSEQEEYELVEVSEDDASQLFEQPVYEEAVENVAEEVAEEGQIAFEDVVEAEKEYSVVIEKSSDKTNVFEPIQAKMIKKSDDTESLFEENEQPAVVEAEQLTFSMTENDLQKSIEEAEAFIFERERIDNPEEVINETENVSGDNILADPEAKQEEFDQTDLWIASAFGDEDEIKNMYGEEAAQEIQTQLDIDVREYMKESANKVSNVKIEEEFTSPSQTKDIFAKYRKRHKIGLIKIAVCLVLALVALFYENISVFGGNLPGALNKANYPVVYILGSFQILVLAAAMAYEEIYRGIRALISFKPLPESITASLVTVSALYHIVHCFVSETDPTVALYVFPVVVCILVTLLYDFFNLKREIYSFNIVASKRLKYTINRVENESATLENEAFGEYLSGENDVSMFKIGKTSFVKGFRERMNSYSSLYSIVSLILSVAVALGLIFFIISTVFFDLRSGFSLGYLAFILAVPACSLLSFSYPFYKASKKAFDDDSAIIGGGSLEEYSRANTLSFDDKDVFPSYGVKVKSIKVYGESRIDKILYNASSVFKVIGGPLSDVFDTATHELGNSENMEIIEIVKDGIESIIDGQHVYIGKSSYLRSRNLTPILEPTDEELESSGEASIMYMVIDDEIAAKIYVQYTIDPDFEFTLRKLYRAGICIGIKTFDPNIDDKLLGSKVKITKYPVRILRCSSLDEVTTPLDEADSGIVSKGGPRSLLNTFVLCSKVLYANRTNVTVKILSILFSVLLMAFLLVFGKVASIPSIWVVLYQVFWIIPVYLISKFYV